MKTIQELKEERAALLKRNNEIYAAVEKESRAISEAELAEINANVVKRMKLADEIADLTAELGESKPAHVTKRGVNYVKAIKDALVSNTRSFELGVEERAAATATNSGAVIPTDVYDIMDAVRDAMVLTTAGATMLTGLKGALKLPKLGAAQAQWAEENGEATDGGAAITGVTMSPKRLTCYVDISNQALIQDSASLQAAIENDLAMAVVEKLQKTVLGSEAGSATKPAGLCNGKEATPITDFKGIATLESKVEEKNVGAIAYIMSPKAKAGIRSLTFPKTTSLIYAGGEVDGVPAYVSNSVAPGQYIVGDFSNVIIGVWDVEITVDTMSQQVNGAVRLVVNGYYDAQYAHTDAFEVGSLS